MGHIFQSMININKESLSQKIIFSSKYEGKYTNCLRLESIMKGILCARQRPQFKKKKTCNKKKSFLLGDKVKG